MRFFSPIDKVHITQWFGERPSYYSKYNMHGHNGIDFRSKFKDTPKGQRYIYACADCKVENVKQSSSGYGLEIRLRLKSGEEAIYAHLSRVDIGIGEILKGGRIIGLTGNTGDSSASHLHFGIRPKNPDLKDGYFGWVDPEPYLNDMINPETNRIMEWNGLDATDSKEYNPPDVIEKNIVHKEWAKKLKLCNDLNWEKTMTKNEVILVLYRLSKIK